MRLAYYKATVAVLALLLAFASFMALQYRALFFDRPSLADLERRAYTAYICQLQEELGYPFCQLDHAQYEFDSEYLAP